ncbi:hypothetical protein [Massilia sp. Se16.2.3]|uniref:hypothetical protein n=1 Tax=Massilia sp. Se16.2.3 TaxID=2709303 RepID=UPI001E35D342|nr:hypothetical protein [Massilia sp. Se16.2.3]
MSSKQENIMAFDLGNLLQQYMNGASGADNTRATEDFERVAQEVPREHVAQGVTQALRSDQTPPFPQMVGQMFGQSNPNQRAGMLNQLLAAAGPSPARLACWRRRRRRSGWSSGECARRRRPTRPDHAGAGIAALA